MKLYQIDLVYNDSIETISGVVSHRVTNNFIFIVCKDDKGVVVNLKELHRAIIYSNLNFVDEV